MPRHVREQVGLVAVCTLVSTAEEGKVRPACRTLRPTCCISVLMVWQSLRSSVTAPTSRLLLWFPPDVATSWARLANSRACMPRWVVDSQVARCALLLTLVLSSSLVICKDISGKDSCALKLKRGVASNRELWPLLKTMAAPQPPSFAEIEEDLAGASPTDPVFSTNSENRPG